VKLPPHLEHDPDTILLRDETAPLIDGRVDLFTVPVTLLTDDGTREWPLEHGSGVLFQFAGRKFLLTAGHVLAAMPKAKRCAVGIRREMHRFAPDALGRVEYRYTPAASKSQPSAFDFGFIEFAPGVASAIDATTQKVFASPNSVHVDTAERLVAANDWVVMAGFPDEVAKHRPQASGYALLYTCTTIAGCGHAPPSVMAAARHQALDLWVPEDLSVYSITGEVKGSNVPRFAGASGGGAWKGGVRPVQPEVPWDEKKMKLIGIHVASTDTIVIDGTNTRFSREVLIGHHLRLIADTTPGLRDALFAAWPVLTECFWASEA
jgi:hypothetical protein